MLAWETQESQPSPCSPLMAHLAGEHLGQLEQAWPGASTPPMGLVGRRKRGEWPLEEGGGMCTVKVEV